MVRVDKAATVVDRVAAITATVTVDRAADSAALRLARITRTATATIMVRADAVDLTVAVRVARADLIVVDREARVASTAVETARADREVLDLVQVEWAVELQFLLLISLASQLKKHLKAKNRYIIARTKSSMMTISLDRRRRLKLLQA